MSLFDLLEKGKIIDISDINPEPGALWQSFDSQETIMEICFDILFDGVFGLLVEIGHIHIRKIGSSQIRKISAQIPKEIDLLES